MAGRQRLSTEKYFRVRGPDPAPRADNELLVGSNRIRSYVSAVMGLLDGGHQSVVLYATDRNINKNVAVAEIVKHRVTGLHQTTAIGSCVLLDVWQPRVQEEGLQGEPELPVLRLLLAARTPALC